MKRINRGPTINEFIRTISEIVVYILKVKAYAIVIVKIANNQTSSNRSILAKNNAFCQILGFSCLLIQLIKRDKQDLTFYFSLET